MRTTRRITQYLLPAMAVLAATGCFKLARESPPVERYVLGGVQPAADSRAPSDTAALAIGIRRLDLAPYLATLDIVVRRADHEIVATGFQRWAETPAVGFNRAVAGYLAATPGIRSVDVVPWPIRSEHDYLVQLHVERLEGIVPRGGAGTGEAQMLARWEIVRPQDGSLMARGVTEHREGSWRVGDFAGLVRHLDEGVAALAKDLGACLARLGPAQPTEAPRGPVLECPSA